MSLGIGQRESERFERASETATKKREKLDLASNDDISGTGSPIDVIRAAFQNRSFPVSNAVATNGVRSFVAKPSDFELSDRSIGRDGKILVNVSINERSPMVIIVFRM